MVPEEQERWRLASVIQEWNSNRLDLFEISQPNKNLEFHGVMRIYLEDRVAGSAATKCLRVSSHSSTCEVMETLLDKIRPDMKMVTTPYSLYEVHANEEQERKLELEEKPLIVQLNWDSNNRDGRFVMKNKEDVFQENCLEKKEKGSMIQNFKRTLSRKDKKKEKNADEKSQRKEKGKKSSSIERLLKTTSLSDPKTQKADVGAGNLKTDTREQLMPPVGIQIRNNSEIAFLSAIINYTNSSTFHFKLSPAYALYLAVRCTFYGHQSQSLHLSGQANKVTLIMNKMVSMTELVIQKQQETAGAVAFWMANTSELLNFIKNDRDLTLITQQAQGQLSHLLHRAYKCLIQCLQNDLKKHMPTFLIDPEQQGLMPAGIEGVLNTLMSAMSLLRRCRVNPALSIQLFSQLFHFISTWLFNKLISGEASSLGLCSHYWGTALHQRLSVIEDWAERQGLELAADCHLGHIIQASTLLTMDKYSIQDVKSIQSACFKLNSLQLKMLLTSYLYASNEPLIPTGLIDSVVASAEAYADDLVRSEGRDIQLEESFDLNLPFLIPEEGYSCDTVHGVPQGFREFMEPLCCKGICSLLCHPHSSGRWTVFFSKPTSSEGITHLPDCREPAVVTITLKKPLNSGMGVSIVAAKGAGQGNLGIYVKSIVKGGPAQLDGRLTAGDQLLSVDGQSLVGLAQERAVDIMMKTGTVVTLCVAKLGACYHGLEALLTEEPSVINTDINANSPAKPNGKTLNMYKSLVHIPPNHLETNHGVSRRKKELSMLRNRQLYRSNPNITDDGEQPVEQVVTGSRTSALSTGNLCPDEYPREYLTLPASRSQERKSVEYKKTCAMTFTPLDGHKSNKNIFLRQAVSQDNLSMVSGGPLVDKHHIWDQQRTSQYASSLVQSSVSTNDIHSNYSTPTKFENGRRSGAGVWRTPLSQNPASSVQPIRIDIPVTRSVHTHSCPPLTTFQKSSTLLAVKSVQNPNASRETQFDSSKGRAREQENHNYSCPISASRKQLHFNSILSQRLTATRKDQVAKPQMMISPSKHVSFQKLPDEQPCVTQRQQEPLYFTISKEVSDGNGLSPDPWRRDEREKLEKRQRLQVVDLLEQEVQDLQAKASRTAEESDRLRRLTLEWKFQRRLQEFQQNEDDEDDDEEEHVNKDVMVTVQQLQQQQDKKNIKEQQYSETKDLDEQTKPHLSQDKHKIKMSADISLPPGMDPQSNTSDESCHNISKEKRDNFKRGPAPEKLTFKERQRLFSLESDSASIKVKAL